VHGLDAVHDQVDGDLLDLRPIDLDAALAADAQLVGAGRHAGEFERVGGESLVRVDIRIVAATKVPLLERSAYVVVQWKQATFNLDLERWLQTVVYLYNSGPSRQLEEPWQFLAMSPNRSRVLSVAKQIAATDVTVLLY